MRENISIWIILKCNQQHSLSNLAIAIHTYYKFYIEIEYPPPIPPYSCWVVWDSLEISHCPRIIRTLREVYLVQGVFLKYMERLNTLSPSLFISKPPREILRLYLGKGTLTMANPESQRHICADSSPPLGIKNICDSVLF